MDDQHTIVKTLRVAASSGQTKVAGHPNLRVATRLNAICAASCRGFLRAYLGGSKRGTATAVVPDLPPNVHLQTFRTSLRSDSNHSLLDLHIHTITSDSGACAA